MKEKLGTAFDEEEKEPISRARCADLAIIVPYVKKVGYVYGDVRAWPQAARVNGLEFYFKGTTAHGGNPARYDVMCHEGQ